MDAIRIRGARKLEGRIPVGGAKNAVQPCATLRSDEESSLRNVPGLRDIETATSIAAIKRLKKKKLAQVGADIARINIADED